MIHADAEHTTPGATDFPVSSLAPSPPTDGRCAATRADGSPCQAAPMASGLCWTHDPRRIEERTAASRRGAALTNQRREIDLTTIKVDLGDRHKVKRLMSDLVEANLQGKLSSSSLTAITGVLNAAIKLAQIEAEVRLAALELRLEEEERARHGRRG
jgi:hypothetical protein